MKLLTFSYNGKTRIGVKVENKILDLTKAACELDKIDLATSYFTSMETLLLKGEEGIDAVRDVISKAPKSSFLSDEEVEFLPPLLNPSKIICIGLNYYSHCKESNAAVPEHPIIFAKFASALLGHQKPIVRPSITEKLDYEAELAVVIGKEGKHIPASKALEYVIGYMNFNDVSARDIQLGDVQWIRGKTLDTFAPAGPYLVTADEIKDPQQLSLKCWINNELRQDSTTGDMIFDIPYLIEFISKGITLKTGDIIATGTPSGVAAFRNPPVFLKEGDAIRIEIGNLGVLENTVVDEGNQN